MRDMNTTYANQLKTGDDASDRNLVNYAQLHGVNI